MEENIFVDGGLFSNISIGDPISRCREEGYADKDIIVDAVLCYGSVLDITEWDEENTRWMSALDFYKRREAIT